MKGPRMATDRDRLIEDLVNRYRRALERDNPFWNGRKAPNL
jgi:hypothetical protein